QIPDPKEMPPERFREVRGLIEAKVKGTAAIPVIIPARKERAMSEDVQQAVRSKYGSGATSGLSTDHAGVRALAEAFGYTPEGLASTPAEANMGPSCGNPTATANLRPGAAAQVHDDLAGPGASSSAAWTCTAPTSACGERVSRPPTPRPPPRTPPLRR